MYKNVIALCLLCVGLEAGHFIGAKPVVSLHKEPREMSEVVGQIIWGEAIEVLELSGSRWIKVQTSSSQEGYVPASSLSEVVDYPKAAKMAMVTTRAAHVYLSKDMKAYPPLMTLPYGSKVELVQAPDVQADRWAQIRLITGEVAYMHRADITYNPSRLAPKEMVNLAKRFIELPYTWGGNSAFGFDNVGFVEMLYRQMGIQLSRNIEEMAEGEEIDPAALTLGDLLFFSLNDSGSIDHVAIYIGNKEFIHASSKNSPPSVQISSLTTPFWQQNLQKCMHPQS